MRIRRFHDASFFAHKPTTCFAHLQFRPDYAKNQDRCFALSPALNADQVKHISAVGPNDDDLLSDRDNRPATFPIGIPPWHSISTSFIGLTLYSRNSGPHTYPTLCSLPQAGCRKLKNNWSASWLDNNNGLDRLDF